MHPGERAKQVRVVNAGRDRQGHLSVRAGTSPPQAAPAAFGTTSGLGGAIMPRFRVKLDIPAIARHLSREEGRDIHQDEIHTWLQEAGFIQDPANSDLWIVSEADLGQVNPSEVLSLDPMTDPD